MVDFQELARTLVDAVYDWSRFNKLQEATGGEMDIFLERQGSASF